MIYQLKVAFIALTVITASIVYAVISDMNQASETRSFINESMLSDTPEENEANIDLFINSL